MTIVKLTFDAKLPVQAMREHHGASIVIIDRKEEVQSWVRKTFVALG